MLICQYLTDIVLMFQVIKDYHLFGIVVFLLFVDCLFLVLWSSLHSLNKKEFVEHKKVSHRNTFIMLLQHDCI